MKAGKISAWKSRKSPHWDFCWNFQLVSLHILYVLLLFYLYPVRCVGSVTKPRQYCFGKSSICNFLAFGYLIFFFLSRSKALMLFFFFFNCWCRDCFWGSGAVSGTVPVAGLPGLCCSLLCCGGSGGSLALRASQADAAWNALKANVFFFSLSKLTGSTRG